MRRRSCLDDLRLIVESLDPIEQSFELALGELRARTEARCDVAGVAVEWRTEIDPTMELRSAAVLHVLRALQEMLAKALRHSQSARIEVSIRASHDTPERLELAVRDYGTGFDPKRLPHVGRGLKSLRTRALKLTASSPCFPRVRE